MTIGAYANELLRGCDTRNPKDVRELEKRVNDKIRLEEHSSIDSSKSVPISQRKITSVGQRSYQYAAQCRESGIISSKKISNRSWIIGLAITALINTVFLFLYVLNRPAASSTELVV